MSRYEYLDRDGLESLRWAEVEGSAFGREPPSALRRMRHGATLLGIPLDEYLEHRERGEHRCSAHRAWEPVERFGTVTKRGKPGLSPSCREGHAEAQRERHRAARGGPR